MLKEFHVCYTLEADIKWETIIKKANATKEDIIQEILEKLENSNYFFLKSDDGDYIINTSSVRYVRIVEEKVLA
jgi:hypothetical protein